MCLLEKRMLFIDRKFFLPELVCTPSASSLTFLSVTSLFLVTEGAIAGATAGVVVETALYPIDTIKTRLQVDYDMPCSWNLDCSIVND